VLTVGTKVLHVLEGTGTKGYAITTEGLSITCRNLLSTSEPTIAGTASSVTLSKLILHFVSCTMSAPPHCAVTNGLIATLALAGRVPTKDVFLLFPEEAGSTHFATIKVESSGGTCVIAGNLNMVTERGIHEEGPMVQVNGLEHTGTKQTLLFEGGATLTNLKLGGESATILGTLLAEVLDEKGAALKWAVVEGK
jgi:hypothetical protein